MWLLITMDAKGLMTHMELHVYCSYIGSTGHGSQTLFLPMGRGQAT